MRAWKSEEEEGDDQNPGGSLFPGSADVKVAEDVTDNGRDSEEEDERGYYEPRICSSEESPRSRSRSRSEDEEEEEDQSGKSVSGKSVSGKSEASEETNKRDSQVPLFNDMEASRNSSFKSSVGVTEHFSQRISEPGKNLYEEGEGGGFEDSFESTFGPASNETVSNTTSGWTTFEHEDQMRQQQQRFESPASRDVKVPGNGSIRESPRQHQHWANSPASRVQQLTTRRCSSSASRDSLAEGGENPFGTDAFAPKTPPPSQHPHFPGNQVPGGSHFPGSESPLARTSITSTPIEFPAANGVSSSADAAAGALSDFESTCFRQAC